jgi:hypothetical protein
MECHISRGADEGVSGDEKVCCDGQEELRLTQPLLPTGKVCDAFIFLCLGC